jgi:hypothetical protein
MALVKSGEKDLEIAVKNDVKPPKKQEILDEDTYIKVLILKDSCVQIESFYKLFFH